MHGLEWLRDRMEETGNANSQKYIIMKIFLKIVFSKREKGKVIFQDLTPLLTLFKT
jgi:hypothetical protein